MGSFLSPVKVDIFMEAREAVALESSSYKTKVWLWYFEDSSIICQTVYEHLSSEHSGIQFTMFVENNRFLPCLNVLMTRLLNSRSSHSVYRIPTHTARYLHPNSHHHPAQKLSIVNAFVHQVISISEINNFQNVLYYLQKALRNNSYEKQYTQWTIKSHLNSLL